MARRKHSDETLATAGKLLAEGLTIADISRQTGVPVSTLRFHLAPARAALAVTGPVKRLRPRRRIARPVLIARLWATAERQVEEIDARLAEAGGDPATLERDAKTLSVLARTVRDLVALDVATLNKRELADASSDLPRDLDAFRRILAQKLVELGKLELGN